MKLLKAISFFSVLLVISCSKKDNGEIQPTKGSITESVYASGVVKSENQYTVYATVSGLLQKIEVTVGQTVSTGQPLFQIESDKAALSTENARLAYQLSNENSRYIQDKIAEMESKVQAAKDKLALDQSVYNRNKNIKQYNIISEVEYERVELAYKNSKSNYEAALKQLSQLKLQLQNEQSKSNINLKINEKSQSDFTVKSAINGELFDVLVKEGTLVNPQTPLAIIGEKNAYLLELDVDENDMVRVKLGQKLIVTMDSYKGKSFEATVDKIYPIMDVRSRTFKIEAHFINLPEKLYPNLTAEANIIVRTKKEALTIPRNYLIDNQYVLVNGDEKRKVKIGLSDYQHVEILDGLTAEETIYRPK
ncbi:HlyD family efflux transporter periplasmic adaptor subunit [Flavobacterium silvisoli]|uniref:HlyD family efflux transporter periplasmic adaptor subunit n=1 Tax=Flavobacterium silvisoli TaxID=2529433 RepID=A0A4Q9Z195_9FLAO|nr:efflux RND transporter periplasmic adaptor subunit [Flavobacterium silvisoli]TBX70087.1 HlyD family efflux transporter periplasmic adaptor subunit [Flavobacterium silvisoli]